MARAKRARLGKKDVSQQTLKEEWPAFRGMGAECRYGHSAKVAIVHPAFLNVKYVRQDANDDSLFLALRLMAGFADKNDFMGRRLRLHQLRARAESRRNDPGR